MFVKIKDDQYVNLDRVKLVHLMWQDIVFLICDQIAYDIGESTVTYAEYQTIRLMFESSVMSNSIYFDAYSYVTKPVSRSEA